MAWYWWLILGALIGWLVEWVIDWVYWRNRVSELREQSAKYEAEIEAMRGERDQASLTLRTLRSDTERAQGELAALRGEYEQSQGLVATLRDDNQRAQAEATTLRTENQRLSRDLAVALEDARALTGLRGEFDQLQTNFAAASAERDQLNAELDGARSRRAEFDTQLQRAKGELESLRSQLAGCGDERGSLQSELASLRGTATEREQEAGSLRARLAEFMAAGAARAEKLVDSGKAFFAGGVDERHEETPELGFSPGGEVVADDVVATTEAGPAVFGATLGAEIPETDAQVTLDGEAGAPTQYRDPLIDIDGIGPAYEQRLFAANIMTFDQLAGLSPDQVRRIVEPDRWQEVELSACEAWIADARQRATTQPLYIASTRDPLIDIDGIGPVYEQKLFSAGVTTFEQLAQMTPAQVRAIIKPEGWQNVDFAAWIAAAAEFAGRRGKERND